MSLTPRVTGALLSAAVLTGAGGLTPAAAATGYDRCPVERFCLFVDPDGDGPYVSLRYGWDDLRKPVNGFVYDNRFSSFWNRRQETPNGNSGGAMLYLDPHHRGEALSVFRANFRGNLKNTFSNAVSSVKVY